MKKGLLTAGMAILASSLVLFGCSSSSSDSEAVIAPGLSLSVNGKAVDQSYLVSVGGLTAIDVAKGYVPVANALSAPLTFANPYSGKDLSSGATITFKVRGYNNTVNPLGTMFSFLDVTDTTINSRLYFTPASYLGFNNGSYFDANLSNYATVTDYIGQDEWKKVAIAFDDAGFYVYVDGTLAYDKGILASSSTGAGNLTDYSQVLTFLTGAEYFTVGAGAWWGDATTPPTPYNYLTDLNFLTYAMTANQAYEDAGNTVVKTTSVVLDQDTLAIAVGDSSTLTATVTPLTSTETAKWGSSDATVATVSSSGVVKALKSGTTTITVTSGSFNDTCTVTVPGISLDKSSLQITTISGGTSSYTLTPSMVGTTGTPTYTWESSNTAVATVSNGLVSAIAMGTATITCSSGSATPATCTVYVGGSKALDFSAVASTYLKAADGTIVTSGEYVIDAKAAFAAGSAPVAAPVQFANPLKGFDLSTGATIAFKTYRYGTIKALGGLFSLLNINGTAVDGRLYFTPYSYLGYNATGGYFDANMASYAGVTDYIGASAWKKVAITFTSSGYTVYVDGAKAYDQTITATSTTGGGTLTDYSKVLTWLSGSATTFVVGTGTWWEAASADEAENYLKDVTFYTTALSATAVAGL